MIIKLEDIPLEGREVDFRLELEPLQERLKAGPKRPESLNRIRCESPPMAELQLSANGKTVIVEGRASGEFLGTCARCAEDAPVVLDIPIRMVMKPHGTRTEDEVEDLQLSYYDGKEIDLSPIVEEGLLLAIPYSVYCGANCKGLCPSCGANLNFAPCQCSQQGEGNQIFQALRALRDKG